MPRKRPPHRARRWTKLQLIQLLHPYIASGIPAFADDAERRTCWEQNRERLMAAAAPGERPVGWWDYEAPEPRDRAISEFEQLQRMGALLPGETGA